MLLTPYIEFFSGQVLIYFLLHATLDATNLSKARLKVIVIGSTRATRVKFPCWTKLSHTFRLLHTSFTSKPRLAKQCTLADMSQTCPSSLGMRIKKTKRFEAVGTIQADNFTILYTLRVNTDTLATLAQRQPEQTLCWRT